ncbi:MAG TPA: hypothetical protein VH724_04000 [Candidatus Angelobacter sp.]|nr:hypothetical protein [Candidatus Angelobacter sp.]
MKRFALLLTSTLLLTAGAAAQDSAPREKTHSFTIAQGEPLTAMPPNINMMFQREKLPEGEIAFFSAEMAGGGEVVTGAPYTATATTESTQILGDGNKIVNKTTSSMARDSQGRTRRETTFNRLGPLQVESPKMVFINDPTTHTQYILKDGGEGTKVVRNETGWNAGPDIVELRGTRERSVQQKVIVTEGGHGEHEIVTQGHGMRRQSSDQVKHEDLGTQTLEGVSAEGKRETITIPAGQIGNERAIEIVSETWYSPELHTMVVRKHSDPRVGETVFKLTDIKRSEPDAALFQAPAGTKMKVEPLLEMHREMAPPKE